MYRPDRYTGWRASVEVPAGATPGTLRPFAGRPDPADPSGFSIPFEAGGRGGTLDGRFTDRNGVELRVRDGPPADP